MSMQITITISNKEYETIREALDTVYHYDERSYFASPSHGHRYLRLERIRRKMRIAKDKAVAQRAIERGCKC